MAPPFRADHIGSLLRPQTLLDARSKISAAQQSYYDDISSKVKEIEKAAVKDVVEEQRKRGIRPITDGEYARHIYFGGLFEKLSGFEVKPDLPIPDAFRTDFPTTVGLARMGAKTRTVVLCTGKIGYSESPYLPEWLGLRSTLPESLWKEAKLTMPAPTYQHIQLKPGTAYTTDSGYTSDEDYFRDLAACYAAELKTLYDAGLRNAQVDDPHLTYFCSSEFLGGCQKDGTDADALLDLYIQAHNQLLVGKPRDLHVGVHLCRGNMAGSTHWVSGSYEKIAYKLFNQTEYQTYYLEFDDFERDGGFEPLRFLPKGKNVVLGLVSTKKTDLEARDDLKRKVRDAAVVIAQAQGVSVEEAMDCLAISPQCGFSSHSQAGGVGMTRDKMFDKLELVKNVAEDIWGNVILGSCWLRTDNETAKMGKKKRKQPNVEELLARPWCYYCERDFEDLKLLISHQKAKHFKCDRCGRRLNTAGGLSVHMNQVHKESLTLVENALPNRQGLEVEIFGMEGIPEDVVQQHNQRLIQNFYQAQADRFAATGNPPPGQSGKEGPVKKIKIETADEIKKRLAEHRARVAAQKAAGGVANPTPPLGLNGQSPGQNNSPFPPPGGQYPQGFPPQGVPGFSPPPQYPQGGFNYPPGNLPARPGGGLPAPPGLPARPGQPGYASTVDELVAGAARQGDNIDHLIRSLEQKPNSATPTAPEQAPPAEEKKSKKEKDKNVKMIYDDEISPEERLALMPRYAYVPTAA